jgi:hybrid cluster-associated redox disulfide protein
MIKKDMTIGEILKKYPETLDVLLKYNLCECEPFKTLEKQCEIYKLDVEKLLKELNEKVER